MIYVHLYDIYISPLHFSLQNFLNTAVFHQATVNMSNCTTPMCHDNVLDLL